MTQKFSSNKDGSGLILDVGNERGNLKYTRLQLVKIDASGSYHLSVKSEELVAIPIVGAFEIAVDGALFELEGRTSPVRELTDYMYVSPYSEVEVSGQVSSRIALAFGPARDGKATRRIAKDEILVSIRGAGPTSRQINGLVGNGAAESDSLIIGENLTPGGGWSSYPAHKHDRQSDSESELEEIYYYEIEDGEGPDGHGFAYQRVWSADERELDFLAEARDGDAIAIPHGWHGPVAVAPGCIVYNLYVMAGPNGPVWNITDHPDQTWIRDTWKHQAPHPALPIAE